MHFCHQELMLIVAVFTNLSWLLLYVRAKLGLGNPKCHKDHDHCE